MRQTFSYGCETWITSDQTERKLETSENKKRRKVYCPIYGFLFILIFLETALDRTNVV